MPRAWLGTGHLHDGNCSARESKIMALHNFCDDCNTAKRVCQRRSRFYVRGIRRIHEEETLTLCQPFVFDVHAPEPCLCDPGRAVAMRKLRDGQQGAA